jgi:predicted transcriptional regulator
MKGYIIAAFLVVVILVIPGVFAKVQYYGIDVSLDEKGRCSITLTITFLEPQNKFELVVFGKLENFEATSNAGPVNCTLNINEASFINCDLPLTQEKRTLEINFDTLDLVKTLDSKFLFSGDFSLNQDIKQVFTSVKLPEGFVVSKGNETNLVNPNDVIIVSDGRKIIVNWKLENTTSSDALKFQVVYEKLREGSFISPVYLVIIGIVIFISIALLVFLILRKIRKPQEVILSVLDEYERKVVQVITEAGGEINQRKVVQETNLSKAKVSRVVKSLVDRGVIETERRGRTNRLKIVKKKIWS